MKAFEAGGTIRRARFVSHSTAADSTVVESNADDVITGIAQYGGREAPIPSATADPPEAAQAGDSVQVHENGEDCLVEYGGTVTRGDLLASDADGKAVTAATGENVGAIANFSGVDGDICGVTVRLQTAA